jgi:predicted lipase
MKSFKNLNKEIIKKLCQSCINSYEGKHGKVKEVLYDVQKYEVGRTKFFTGLLDEDTLVITFEGSDGKLDWKDNLTFEKELFAEKAKVHKGFLTQFLTIFTLLNSVVTKNLEIGVHKLIFTGHSLGAALATLAACYYGRNCYVSYPEWLACVTFGSPRIGDKEFVKLFNRSVYYSWRYVNNNDIVCKVPFALPTFKKLGNWLKPYWMNFRHIPNKIKLRNKMNFFSKFNIILKIYGSIKDHYPENYLQRIF